MANFLWRLGTEASSFTHAAAASSKTTERLSIAGQDAKLPASARTAPASENPIVVDSASRGAAQPPVYIHDTQPAPGNQRRFNAFSAARTRVAALQKLFAAPERSAAGEAAVRSPLPKETTFTPTETGVATEPAMPATGPVRSSASRLSGQEAEQDAQSLEHLPSGKTGTGESSGLKAAEDGENLVKNEIAKLEKAQIERSLLAGDVGKAEHVGREFKKIERAEQALNQEIQIADEFVKQTQKEMLREEKAQDEYEKTQIAESQAQARRDALAQAEQLKAAQFATAQASNLQRVQQQLENARFADRLRQGEIYAQVRDADQRSAEGLAQARNQDSQKAQIQQADAESGDAQNRGRQLQSLEQAESAAGNQLDAVLQKASQQAQAGQFQAAQAASFEQDARTSEGTLSAHAIDGFKQKSGAVATLQYHDGRVSGQRTSSVQAALNQTFGKLGQAVSNVAFLRNADFQQVISELAVVQTLFNRVAGEVGRAAVSYGRALS